MNPFASLKELRFEEMPEWESWSHFIFIKEEVRVFPNLEIPKCLWSLVKLDVSECPELVSGLPELASLHELNLQKCDEAMSGGDEVDLRSLATLELKKMSRLNCLRIGLTGSLVAWERLVIGDCGGLACLWEEQVLPCNLKILRIEDSANLEKLPNGLFLKVYNCDGLKWMPHNYYSCALEYLRIEKCPSLICFPHGELPTTLKELFIGHCEKVESLPEGMIH
ncbi:hypothetical protein PVL29_017456 [Vitis rotundifolia]|uniref:Disease resistance protein n=1 Tax=Vitis rotundifolia TaxID=103349 RepID=A0AA38ZAR9_VITRO|nr:hypothetical protein PVL29_017456 [Vitis rotundifolia]